MDAIKGIGAGRILGEINPTKVVPQKGQVEFSSLLKDAINNVDGLQKEADKAIEKFTGGDASLHETMIAVEKANVSFQLMLQARNKIISAYEEIMRTQI
ncbi:MAG: flagellar hook-basal body complex protein FliE [Deltaproteobacteria bacterium]|nr:flagellar hook-basal body complex protein FliE [Deltaproteobacteria bacterium]